MSATGPIAPHADPVGQQRFVHRYWNAFRTFADARLADVAQDLRFDWHLFLGWTAVIAIVLVGLLRLIQTLALGFDNAIFAWLGIALPATLAAACIVALVWAYWRIRLEPTATRPYVVALLSSIVTIGVCAEAFAGLTTMLWQQGSITSSQSPDLWTTESYYLWHLLNAVPFLGIPETLGWSRPDVFADQLSGSLLLAFKIVVIVPLVRIALSGYQLVETHRLKTRDDEAVRQRRLGVGTRPVRWRPVPAPATFAGLLGASAVAWVIASLLFEPTSFVNRWLVDWLPGSMDVGSAHVSLSWLWTVPQWVAIGALLGLLWLVVGYLLFIADLTRDESLLAALAGLGSYVCVLTLLTVLGATVTLALMHVGAVTPQPTLPEGGQLWAALDAYAWPVVDAIPGLEIPSTLHWSLNHRFDDHVSGALLLAYKAAFFGVLIFPLARLVRAYLHRARPRPPRAAVLGAGREFSAQLRNVRSALADAERLVLAYRDERAGKRTSPRTIHRPPASVSDRRTLAARLADDPRWRARSASLAARRQLEELEASFDRVEALFGGDAVSAQADAALSAALRYHATLERGLIDWFERIGDDELKAGVEQARTALTRAADDYTQATAASLRAELAHDW